MHSARAYMQALQIIKDKSWILAEVSGVNIMFILPISSSICINVTGVSYIVYVY